MPQQSFFLMCSAMYSGILNAILMFGWFIPTKFGKNSFYAN